MKPKVSVLIVNWNGWKDTIECLESLYQIDYPNYNVIVIDNGSQDESLIKIKEYCEGKIKVDSEFFEFDLENKPINILEIIREECEKNCRIKSEFFKLPSSRKLVLIKNHKNDGFTGGNNIGIRYALKNGSDYILLLNNDTVVSKNFLNELIHVAENDPKIGVCGPKIYYYNNNGKKDVVCFEGGKLNIFKGEAFHNMYPKPIKYPQEVDYVEGSCFLIKKDTINEAGIFDEDYFLYWEETDWCFRIRKKGYKLMHIPKAEIWHKVDDSLNETITYYMTRNRFLFMKKNSTKLQMFSFLIYQFLFKFWIRLFGYLFYYQEPKISIYYLKGIIDGLNLLISYSMPKKYD